MGFIWRLSKIKKKKTTHLTKTKYEKFQVTIKEVFN